MFQNKSDRKEESDWANMFVLRRIPGWCGAVDGVPA